MTTGKYETLPADVVKSVRQRWMLTYWIRLRADRPLPAWADLDEDELESSFDDLSIIDVLPHNGTHIFRIRNHGKNVGAMFADECAGKLLADTLPDATRAATLETYEYATGARMPVFTTSEVNDAHGRVVLYERLLLPFSEDGKRVTRILAFLETISHEGTFRRRELLVKAGGSPAQYSLKAVLQT
jgi:hypothetical protein